MSPSLETRPTPTRSMGLETFGNFDLVKRLKLDFANVIVSKWRSRVTGLDVVHLDYDAPIVNGYFVVATEIFNDSGCPHTLEHLVFMGSEKYPYKGLIDQVANRGFSNGTNAWTDTDHTAYTVSTAGGQGFLQILPIYIDHILYPTLTKSGFVTEVHHINGKGQDSGVVYSEMQGRQNTSGDLLSLRMQRLLNPPGSAYRSETGGLMEALRVLTIDQIRDYHQSYYVPHNLSLIVAGKLSSGTSTLLSVIQNKVEPSLIAHHQNAGPRPPGWKRPFVETLSAIRAPIEKTLTETVEFPEKDESMGELIINFMGPPREHFLERKALDVLGTYMTSSATAPLNKEFIEVESPLCSYIYFTEETRATLVDLPVFIGSVPTEHLDGFHEKLKTSFKRIATEGIDMERMAMVIRRDERQLRSKLESSSGDAFSSAIISDFLYGKRDGSELYSAMDDINEYSVLKKWTGRQWEDLLRKYYVDQPCLVVCGKPSASLAKKLERDERSRITDQMKRLGHEGLKKAEKELQEAKAEHDRPIPTDILTSFPLPDVKTIAWIPVQSYQEAGTGRVSRQNPAKSPLSKLITSDGHPLPFFVQYDHVQSDFITVHALFSSAKLPDRLRPYILTYLSSFFSLPVKRHSGEHLTHEEVVNKLDNETVSYDCGLGMYNQLCETLRVSIKVEKALYDIAVVWLRDLVYGSVFNKERLLVTAAKMQQSIPEMKRDGSVVASSVWGELLYSENSTSRVASVLSQSEFIPKLVKQLQESPDQVVADFNEIRKCLTDPTGIRFSLTGNVLDLKGPRSVLGKHFGPLLPAVALSPVTLSSDTLSPLGKNPAKKAVVMSLPTVESSFATHTTKGIQGFNHPDYPVLRVAAEVLNATESFLWRYIRGSGLAYGANVYLDTEAGQLSFTLYRSSNCLQAFKEAANVIKGLTDGSLSLDATLLDAAKSSIVYGVAKNVSSAERAAIVSFTNQALKGVSKDSQVEMLQKFQAVTKEEVLDAFRNYFSPLFDPSSSMAVIVTAPSNTDEITEGLASQGFDVEKRTLEVDPMDFGEGEDGSDSCSESEGDDSNESEHSYR